MVITPRLLQKFKIFSYLYFYDVAAGWQAFYGNIETIYCIETIMFDSTVPRDNMLAKL